MAFGSDQYFSLDIGKEIVKKQESHNCGKAIVENLSKDLQKDFPGVQGFSVRNLWNMRSFGPIKEFVGIDRIGIISSFPPPTITGMILIDNEVIPTFQEAIYTN